MVHAKAPARPRGRPRAYDPERALGHATEAFWRDGYSATSLETLGAATGMNRPSLYGAFGDKRALYLKALDRYVQRNAEGADRVLADAVPVAQALRRFYEGALRLYFGADGAARGCLLTGTALTEAATDPTIRARLQQSLQQLEDKLRARFRRARREGAALAADPDTLASLALATLLSLSVMARAGEPRAALVRRIDATLALLCPAAPRRRGAGRRP